MPKRTQAPNTSENSLLNFSLFVLDKENRKKRVNGKTADMAQQNQSPEGESSFKKPNVTCDRTELFTGSSYKIFEKINKKQNRGPASSSDLLRGTLHLKPTVTFLEPGSTTFSLRNN